jgi:WD40 repeat protein
VAWSPDSRYIASIAEDGTVQVWNATNSLPLFTYQGHQQPATAVAWSPNSYKIASASRDKTIHVWSIE